MPGCQRVPHICPSKGEWIGTTEEAELMKQQRSYSWCQPSGHGKWSHSPREPTCSRRGRMHDFRIPTAVAPPGNQAMVEARVLPVMVVPAILAFPHVWQWHTWAWQPQMQWGCPWPMFFPLATVVVPAIQVTLETVEALYPGGPGGDARNSSDSGSR